MFSWRTLLEISLQTHFLCCWNCLKIKETQSPIVMVPPGLQRRLWFVDKDSSVSSPKPDVAFYHLPHSCLFHSFHLCLHANLAFFFLISVLDSYPSKLLLWFNMHVSQFAQKRYPTLPPHPRHAPSPILNHSFRFFSHIQKPMNATSSQWKSHLHFLAWDKKWVFIIFKNNCCIHLRSPNTISFQANTHHWKSQCWLWQFRKIIKKSE